MYDTSGERALIFINRLARVTLAVGKVSVILAHGYHVPSWIGLEYRVDTLTDYFKHFRIAQAPLACLAGMTFAAEIRIILGMLHAIS